MEAGLLAELQSTLADPGVQYAAWLTFKVSAWVLALHACAGLALGYALSIRRWPGKAALDALVTVPLVFPPMALGFVLLLLLGRRGPLGGLLQSCCDVSLVFSLPGVILAAFIAGLPLVVKPVQAALEGLNARMAEVARTLGKREWEIALFVLLPNVRRALMTGLILGLGRSLGEVGITLMLGGNIAGRTNTLSLEIYNAVFAADYARGIVLTGLLALASLLVFWSMKRLGVAR